MKHEILNIENGTYRTQHHTVLKNIFVQLYQGETLAILFNNSEEKKVFLDYLMGTLPMVYGRLYLLDEQIPDYRQKSLLQKLVYVIRHPSSLSQQFSVLENLYYGKFNFVFISLNKYEKQAKKVLAEFGLNFNLHARTSQLTSFECIQLELIKAYIWDYRIIVMSNITGKLDQNEKQVILSLLQKLKKRSISFMLIGGLEEVLFEHSDTITIIQGGQSIGTYKSSDINSNILHKLLYSYSLTLKDMPDIRESQDVFVMHNITTNRLKNISLTLHRGEAIKIIYSDDSTAKELVSVLRGSCRSYQGSTYLNHEKYQAIGVADALRKGIAFVEENPIEAMLFKNLSIIDNICFPLSSKIPGFWLKKKYKKSIEKTLRDIIPVTDFKKKIADVSTETLYLVVYCKWLLFMPKVLVCLNPFSEADVVVNQIIDQMITYLTKRGIAVMILSSCWPSISAIAGRTYFLDGENLLPHGEQEAND